jgi:3'(2'), 5'-bisphosphate nucleotidase
VLASRSHGNAETDDFINKLQLKHHGLSLQNAGSSYKFCLLAEGSATHYPRFGPTMEWDIAAGVAILLNAGGKACIWPEMTTLLFNKPDLTNPFFLAVGYGVEE